jgi:hypothetical protein
MSGDARDIVQRIYGIQLVDIDLPYASNAVVVNKGSNVNAQGATVQRSICVQKIRYTPSTWAQSTLTFSDSLTNTVIGIIWVPAAAPQIGDSSDEMDLEWGPGGTKLSPGANLNLAVSANGAIGRLHIESYQKGLVYPTH